MASLHVLLIPSLLFRGFPMSTRVTDGGTAPVEIFGGFSEIL